ncbi:MAG: hypothetical protein H6Q89_662 [Myxococcaceae bacterium]|nr:hypothetical protein [Myxococcaceae bacterium]
MRRSFAVLALIGCASAPVPATPPVSDAGSCRFGPARAGPVLGDADLIELSGLVASRASPGVLYAHNDSGDTARFFAMDTEARPLGRFELEGATAIDWEDMTLGPCPDGTCLFLGDIGDNLKVRTDLAVYRLKEPAVAVGAPVGTVKVASERFAFQYPNAEKFNAETLFAHPTTGELYVANKLLGGEPSSVFKFPLPMDSSKTATLIKVADLKVPEASDQALTGGALSPDGKALLLRTYNRLIELRLPAGAPFEQIFAATAISVPVSAEQQGEAVAWRADGRGYFTASEEVGVKPTLNRVECQP